MEDNAICSLSPFTLDLLSYTFPPIAQHQLWALTAPPTLTLGTFAPGRFPTPDFYTALPSPMPPPPPNFLLPFRYHSEASPSHSAYKCTLPNPTPTPGPFICLHCMAHPLTCSLHPQPLLWSECHEGRGFGVFSLLYPQCLQRA